MIEADCKASYKTLMTAPIPTADDLQAAHAILASDPELEGFPPDQLMLILKACEWRRVPAGRRLFSAGDTTGTLHAVVTGFITLETALAIPDLPLVNLLEGPFWVYGRPQHGGRIRLNTATARTPLLVAQISQARFEALAARDPALYDFKAWVAAALFWKALEAVTDALIPDTRHRAISTLLRVAGRKQSGDTPAAVPITQTELAAITNLSRQTCGELLRGLERHGLIRLGYREIEVLAPARLRAMIA